MERPQYHSAKDRNNQQEKVLLDYYLNPSSFMWSESRSNKTTVASAIVVASLSSLGASWMVYQAFQRDRKRRLQEIALSERQSIIATVRPGIHWKYSVRECGCQNPPIAVVLHDGHDHQGLMLAAKILPPNYKVIILSQSAATTTTTAVLDQSVEQRCHDLHHLLTKQLRIQTVSVMVGMSLGSVVALRYTSLFPKSIESLVLLSPWVPFKDAAADKEPRRIPDTWLQQQQQCTNKLGSEFAQWAFLRLGRYDSQYGMTQDTSAEERQFVMEFVQTGFAMKYCNDRAALLSYGMTLDQMAAIQCPILYLAAEDDPYCKPSEHRLPACLLGNVSSLIRPTGGHWLLGDYQRTQREVQAFLESHGAECSFCCAMPRLRDAVHDLGTLVFDNKKLDDDDKEMITFSADDDDDDDDDVSQCCQ